MLAFLLAAALAVSAITMRISERFVAAEETRTRVELFVPLNEDNQQIGVEWEGDGPYSNAGRTLRQLDGEDEGTYYVFTIRLTPGDYVIRGLLLKGGKVIVTPVIEVTVIGSRP